VAEERRVDGGLDEGGRAGTGKWAQEVHPVELDQMVAAALAGEHRRGDDGGDLRWLRRRPR
jgi:hypothetical protein